MRTIILLIIFFKSVWSFSQVDSQDLSLEIKEMIKHHEEDIRSLYNYRGAPQSWIDTDNVDDESLYSVTERYDKNVGLLIYTYSKDTLKISLFSSYHEYNEVKKGIDSSKLQNYVNDVNYLFSSHFLNRAPKKRGAIGNNKAKSSSEDVNKSFNVLNNLLLPKELNLSRFDHLIIVPTFNIATLPFSAFYIDETFLIDRMSYSIAPNLFELMYSNDINRKKFGEYYDSISYSWNNALFVANPIYPDNLDWDFPNLPGAEEEVNHIIKNTNPNNYKKFDKDGATKENILSNICEYDLLYFATHGVSNSNQPMDHSFLVLADNGTETSYLSLREIMNIRKKCKLEAELVVLSACQTGLGKSHRGGIIGLARAFQIAGANHVLMSLWNISDNETATLMEFFFEELSQSNQLMPHAALRNAILKYKSEINDDPKFWAAFSIFGVPY